MYQGHKTDGIDMYITPERAILLDTEPILSWTILDNVLRNGSLGGLHPDVWLEMESLYNIIFMMSVCNIVLVVNDGPKIDMDVLKLIQRAEMLKFSIPDFPLLVGQQDMHHYPDIVFVCNKCQTNEFKYRNYSALQAILTSFFEKSQLKTRGKRRRNDSVNMSSKQPCRTRESRQCTAFVSNEPRERSQSLLFTTAGRY